MVEPLSALTDHTLKAPRITVRTDYCLRPFLPSSATSARIRRLPQALRQLLLFVFPTYNL